MSRNPTSDCDPAISADADTPITDPDLDVIADTNAHSPCHTIDHTDSHTDSHSDAHIADRDGTVDGEGGPHDGGGRGLASNRW